MNILIFTRTGAALGLAQRLAFEGHQIVAFSDILPLEETGRGIYTIANNLWKAIQECKFIVSDSGDCEQLYNRAKTYNKPVIGCHPMADIMNKDAIKEYELGKKLGVQFPRSELFDDSSDIHPKIMEGKKINYFIKHDRKSYICTRPEWLAWAMYRLPSQQRVLLQESVIGFDLSVIGWFNGLNWLRPFFYASPYAERAGGVLLLAQKKLNRLTERTIDPLGDWLKILDYKGPVIAHLIVNNDGQYVKRFEIGLSALCVFAMLESFRKLPLSDFLVSLAFSNGDSIDVLNDYVYGIEVKNRDPDMHGAPILGVNKENLKHIFLQGVYKEEEDYMVSSEVNRVYTATAFGRDPHEAAQRVYREIKEVQFPKMEYMTNIMARTNPMLNNLRNWNIL